MQTALRVRTRTGFKNQGRVRQLLAFSLLEILTVIALVAILAALLLPSIDGMSNSAGRRGAVNLVMGVLDQARVAALEQGRNVHVVLVRRVYPENDAVVVLREDENGFASEQLSRILTLPKNVLFAGNSGGINSNIFSQPVESGWSEVLDQMNGVVGFARLTFGPSGTVLHPTGSNNNVRRIHLLEGVREGEFETPRTHGLDVISVARYTGRPQLDVSLQ